VSRNYDFRNDNFHELAHAIRVVTLCWNDLVMELSDLFWAATRIPNGMAPETPWNAVAILLSVQKQTDN
jgi:hypothetical protein